MKTWLKGGLIGAGIGALISAIVSFVLSAVLVISDSMNWTGGGDQSIFFGIFLMTAIFISVSLIPAVIVGAIIGLIVQKVRKLKK